MIKIYVELGMGVGILVDMLYEVYCDKGLVCFNVEYLFDVNIVWLGLK